MPSGQGHDHKLGQGHPWILKNKISSGQEHGLDFILTPSTWSLFDINYLHSIAVPHPRSNASPSKVSSSCVKVAAFLESRINKN